MDTIRIRGARENNLRNLDLDLPRQRLVVISGPSGSGKSSLLFDTLYAEGQRRYVESLSTYTRQFLERLRRPELDALEGIGPAVAIRQQNSVQHGRSTVATYTEIADVVSAGGGKVITTAATHMNGTSRVAEAVEILPTDLHVMALGAHTRSFAPSAARRAGSRR